MRIAPWILVAAGTLASCQVEQSPPSLTASRWSDAPASVGASAFVRPEGLYVAVAGEEPRLIAPGGEDPLLSPDGRWVLFRRAAGFAKGFDTELWTVSVFGGAPVRVWAASPGQLAESPAWSESGAWVVFTRVRYRLGAEGPELCTPASCEGPAREVVLQRLEGATKAAAGPSRALGQGTVAQLSRDDRYVTWLDGSRMSVQEIDPEGAPLGRPFAHPFESQMALAAP